MKKAIYILATAAMLTACSTHQDMVQLEYSYSSQYDTPSPEMDSILAPFRLHCDAMRTRMFLSGKWKQPNVTLKFDEKQVYHYKYKKDGYTNQHSGRYYADKDSVVLYGFYPDAHTPESKNMRWSIRKLTPDTLTVYVHKNIVTLDNDTLNPVGNEIETFVRRK